MQYLTLLLPPTKWAHAPTHVSKPTTPEIRAAAFGHPKMLAEAGLRFHALEAPLRDEREQPSCRDVFCFRLSLSLNARSEDEKVGYGGALPSEIAQMARGGLGFP